MSCLATLYLFLFRVFILFFLLSSIIYRFLYVCSPWLILFYISIILNSLIYLSLSAYHLNIYYYHHSFNIIQYINTLGTLYLYTHFFLDENVLDSLILMLLRISTLLYSAINTILKHREIDIKTSIRVNPLLEPFLKSIFQLPQFR